MKFINRLTHEEILELIPFYHVYDFEECEPTKPDTRRFSIQPTYGGIYEDVVIGDSYDEGTVRFYGVKEDAFLCFMVKKFGEEYYEWYKDHEKVKTFGIITKLLSEYEEKIKLCKSFI